MPVVQTEERYTTGCMRPGRKVYKGLYCGLRTENLRRFAALYFVMGIGILGNKYRVLEWLRIVDAAIVLRSKISALMFSFIFENEYSYP